MDEFDMGIITIILITFGIIALLYLYEYVIYDWESFPKPKTAIEKLSDNLTHYDCWKHGIPDDCIEARAYVAIAYLDIDVSNMGYIDVDSLKQVYDSVHKSQHSGGLNKR